MKNGKTQPDGCVFNFNFVMVQQCSHGKTFLLEKGDRKKGSPVKGQPVLRNYAQLRLKKAEEGTI